MNFIVLKQSRGLVMAAKLEKLEGNKAKLEIAVSPENLKKESAKRIRS